MDDNKLLDQLSQLGFPLMATSGKLDANRVLADVLKSGDMRLLEGFPVILANAAREYDYDYGQVDKNLGSSAKSKRLHKALVLVSLALYNHYHLTLPWTRPLKNRFSENDHATLKKFGEAIHKDSEFEVSGFLFDAYRLKSHFDHYFTHPTQKTRDLKEKYEELSIEYALSQVFSPKQKELFMKKLKGEVLNKTEREYYSRTVKKKVAALANADVHGLAKRLLEM